MVMIIVAVGLQPARAGMAVEIDKEVDAALEKRYSHSPVAKDFPTIAKGILLFPDVYKSMASFGNK
ncbi:hypothetical protein ACTRXD_17740 [Nitrospira sp. T9]|uniref:hypothetical protein n=1 Tax=unclassified Nitrospira TaxID=2652172 RepID=UPI003F96AC6B